jgi:hypothetical protein
MVVIFQGRDLRNAHLERAQLREQVKESYRVDVEMCRPDICVNGKDKSPDGTEKCLPEQTCETLTGISQIYLESNCAFSFKSREVDAYYGFNEGSTLIFR